MSVYTFREKQFCVEGVPFEELAATYGTPLYVYSKKAILDDIRRIEQAFDGVPHLTYYAVKANANPAIAPVDRRGRARCRRRVAR